MTSTPLFRPVASALIAAGLIAVGALPGSVGQAAAQSKPMPGSMMPGSMMHRPDGAASPTVEQSKPGEAPEISAALVNKGHKIATTVAGIGCTGCHGTYGEGDMGIGPYIRGVSQAKIEATIAGVAQMSFLKKELDPAEVKAVAAYFSWLGSLKLVKTLVKRGHFLPESVEVPPGVGVQLVISNAGTRPYQFSAEKLGVSEFTVKGRDDQEVILATPVAEGDYVLKCLQCTPENQNFIIHVTKAAAPVNMSEASAPFVALLPELAVNKMAAAPAAAPTPAPSAAELIAQGRDIFLHVGDVGCVACHGPYAEGDVGIGPMNRGMDEAAIRKALASVEAMQFLKPDLTEDGIKAIAAYYQRMGELALIKTHLVKGRFFPDRIEVKPGQEIQLVVVNRDPELANVTADGMGLAPWSIPGYGQDDRIWTAPKTPGQFELTCTDCASKDTPLTIVVSQAK